MDYSEAVQLDNARIRHFRESKDVRYLGELYESYKHSIYMQCLKMLGDEEDAKDLASETFIKAFDRLNGFKDGAPFFPWLKRIATNLCIDHLRQKGRYTFYEFDEYRSPVSKDDAVITDKQAVSAERILGALKKLKPGQKRCFCLFYIHNFSYKEIAELTGYPPGKVRSYIQNGKRNFKLLMERQ